MSTLTTQSRGGTRIQQRSQTCGVWGWTTYPSQVRDIPSLSRAARVTRRSSDMSCSLTASSVDVERVFSRGRLLLPHTRNRLSSESIRALMCLGAWSREGLVSREDLLKVAELPDLVGDDEVDENGVPLTVV